MIHLIRTNSENKDFIYLVKQLDDFLTEIDGADHPFYAQFNKIDAIKYVVIACENETPVGCGAIKQIDAITMEVKRMYVTPNNRGKGIASQILFALEEWTAELSFSKCILETSIRLPEAMKLYKKSGYHIIPNYGQYANAENSICFEKLIK
jgi:GNAT superfamily N-acetyltransferase